MPSPRPSPGDHSSHYFGGTNVGQEIHPKELTKPTPYSLGIKVQNHLWVAGQTAVNEKDEPVGLGDPKAQAEMIFRRIGMILKEAGATPQDVVFVRSYTTDMRYQPLIREVRAAFFGGHRPASTSVQVVALARPEFLLEVEVEAVIGSGSAG
jgi:3-hydroxyisobutyrate dehydrogenase